MGEGGVGLGLLEVEEVPDTAVGSALDLLDPRDLTELLVVTMIIGGDSSASVTNPHASIRRKDYNQNS